MAENEKKKNKALVPILIIVLIVVVVAAAVVILKLLNKEDDKPESTSEQGIGYEINAAVLTSGDITVSQPEGVAIRFKPMATSSDGENFACEIANSYANALDIYIDIYMDATYDDEIYLSGLMRPGEGITSFTTTHPVPSGTYDVVLVATTVEDDHKTIRGQTAVALTLVVENN